MTQFDRATTPTLAPPVPGWDPAVRTTAWSALILSLLGIAGLAALLATAGLANRLTTEFINGETTGVAVVGILVGLVAAQLVTAFVGGFWFAGSTRRTGNPDADRGAMLRMRTIHYASAITFVLALVTIVVPMASQTSPWQPPGGTLSVERITGRAVYLAMPVLNLTVLGSAWVAIVARQAAASIGLFVVHRPGFEAIVQPNAPAPLPLPTAGGSAAPPPLHSPSPATRPLPASADEGDPWRAVLAALLLAMLAMRAPFVWQVVSEWKAMSDPDQWTDLRDFMAAVPDRGRPDRFSSDPPGRDAFMGQLAMLAVATRLLLGLAQATLVAWATACVLFGPRLRRTAFAIAAGAVAAYVVILAAAVRINVAFSLDDGAGTLFGRIYSNIPPNGNPQGWAQPLIESLTIPFAAMFWELIIPLATLVVLSRWPVKALFEQVRDRRG